jgi:hypothetical protein
MLVNLHITHDNLNVQASEEPEGSTIPTSFPSISSSVPSNCFFPILFRCNSSFGCGIEGRGNFVRENYFGVFQDCAGYCDTLMFAAAETETAFAFAGGIIIGNSVIQRVSGNEEGL